MQLGIKFPTREIGRDRRVIDEWVAAAEDTGYSYLCLNDHVLGVDPSARPEYGALYPKQANRSPYTFDEPFHEAMVMMGYFAGRCSLGMSTSVMIVPQRQTALLAKQCAEVDFLTDGKLRLGVGVGWNPVEYEALEVEFTTRGKRLDEQIHLMRELWTRPTVDFEGRFHRVVGAGITPTPVQQPIPVWVGGFSERALVRAGELGDGWLATTNLPVFDEHRDVVRRAAERVGRDPDALPFEGYLSLGNGWSFADAGERVTRWRSLGASYLTVDTMGAGLVGAQHIEALRAAAQLVFGA